MELHIMISRIQVLLLLSFTTLSISAQELDKCRDIVNVTIESINDHSAEKLQAHLADDFALAGQKGETAKLVLNQLFSQIRESVKSYDEVSQHEKDDGLQLVYKIHYENMGLKEATFTFNESNLLKDLALFDMKVKTMCSDPEVVASPEDVIEIPFKMAGRLIAVEVLLSGQYRTFILDSGAPQVILNSKYFAEGDTRVNSISNSKGANGSISGMDIIKVNQLDFAGIKMNNQDVITMDLSHLEESLGTEFYGLIGYGLIKDYDIVFDYEKLNLTLINPAIFESYWKENLSGRALERVPFDLEGHIPIVKAQVGDKILSYGIDSGAESNLLSETLLQPLQKHTKRIKMDELVGADNQPKNVKKGKIKNTTIGNLSFKNLETLFSDISHLNEGYKIQIDGIIGYEILHKQKTLLSYHRSEIIFFE